MQIYFTPHNYCLPICNYCGKVLDRHGLRDTKGNYYHPTCYEIKYTTLVQYITLNIQHIIEYTKDNNARANTVAHRILRELNETDN